MNGSAGFNQGFDPGFGPGFDPGFNGGFQQQSVAANTNMLVDSSFNTHPANNVLQPHQPHHPQQPMHPVYNSGNNPNYAPARPPPEKNVNSQEPVVRNPPQYLLERAIHKLSPATLLRILEFITPPQTRTWQYQLCKLSHICRSWRMLMLSQPRAWATIFMTRKDRRGFIEMCLERSQPIDLEVTMDARDEGQAQPLCTCEEDTRERLIPNEGRPCEWHFQFESLTESGHSKRVLKLNINFRGTYFFGERRRLALGSCRFFTLSFPRLVSLEWLEDYTEHGSYIFSIPPFPPTLRSLYFTGSWDGPITQINNLTSFTFERYDDEINVEAFRLFISNNRSLESLSLKHADFEGNSRGPPVNLFNIKSFTIDFHAKNLSTIIRIPALQRLSFLLITMDDPDDSLYRLRATGDGIMLSTICGVQSIAEVWQDLTGYVRPTIHHIRFYDDLDDPEHEGHDGVTLASLLVDVRTLEIGKGYWTSWYSSFVEDLKQIGPQLKTIRFAISDEHEPFPRDEGYEDWGGFLLDQIEELVRFRFGQGRPFSVVERMVVSGSERTNRQEDYVWRCFYGSRRLSQCVR